MRVIGICRLTREPELRNTQGGTAMAKFSVAYNSRCKGEEQAHFFDCTAWGKTAEVLAQYADKGTQILLDGRLEQHRWENDEGQKRSKVEITVDRITFVGSKKDAEQAPAGRSGGLDDPPF